MLRRCLFFKMGICAYLLEEVVEELGGGIPADIAAVHIHVLACFGGKALRRVAYVELGLDGPVMACPTLYQPLPKHQRQDIPSCAALNVSTL